MRDSIICRLPDPNPNRTGKHLPAVVNAAVSNFVVTALLSLVLANRRFTYLNPTGAKVGKFTSHDSVAHATSPQLQTVVSQIRKRAVLKFTFVRSFSPYGPGHTNRRLRNFDAFDLALNYAQ